LKIIRSNIAQAASDPVSMQVLERRIAHLRADQHASSLLPRDARAQMGRLRRPDTELTRAAVAVWLRPSGAQRARLL
jgi:hypothetical protein